VADNSPAVLRVRYRRTQTATGQTFYRTASRLTHWTNPTDYAVRFPFGAVAYTDTAVVTYAQALAADLLGPADGRRPAGRVQTVCRFDQDSCREYVYEDGLNTWAVCPERTYYDAALHDTLHVFSFKALKWISGQWLPHECHVSKRYGLVAFKLSIKPNHPERARTAFPGYDTRNDLFFRLVPPGAQQKAGRGRPLRPAVQASQQGN
jgi:hypothetical protein